MKKHTSQEAFYHRMRELAETKKNNPENTVISNGTLVDTKKAPDGINYGIIKENHKYFIKKGNSKDKPELLDFVYIGGLENITAFRYDSLSEADKNRNMIFNNILEGQSQKFDKKGKIYLTEDKAGVEIEKAEDMIDDLNATTEKAKEEPEMEIPEPEMELDNTEVDVTAPEDEENLELGDGELEGGEPEGELGDENSEEEVTDTEGDDNETDFDDPVKEIEKNLGKITNKIRNTEMTIPQVKYSINTFIAAFKDKLPEVEIEDRKSMANKLLKITSDKEIEDLGNEMAADEPISDIENLAETETCNECGGFAQYAESRGYTKESIMECDNDEMTNLVSGYANAHNDDMNDGDFEAVALFINPEITDSLKNDYGHDEYTEKLTPYTDSINETSDEDKQLKIDELWGGLGNMAKKGAQAVGGAIQKGAQAVGGAVQNVKQTYHAGEKNSAMNKLETMAADLAKNINYAQTQAKKAGQEPINTQSLLQTLTAQVQQGKQADLSKFKTTEEIETSDEIIDEEVQLMVNLIKNVKNLNKNNREEYNTLNNKLTQQGELSDEDTNKMLTLLSNAKEKQEDEITESVKTKEKPSAGLSKEKKSEVVKKAKKSEDIGKKGKGFEKVVKKAEKEYGSKEKGEKVAAAAMLKNIKKESKENEEISESERNLRNYIKSRIQEKKGLKKSTLIESKKSESLKKLDKLIDQELLSQTKKK